jgi:hypothetical protein
MIDELLALNERCTFVSPHIFESLWEDVSLPDRGSIVKGLADRKPGGAFDPRDLEKVPAKDLGYQPRWVPLRYTFYGLPWDITGLKLKSLSPEADRFPWIVIINGGSANLYEFFLTPLNEPGWGQFLAQRMNVLIASIPGNFKYGGWTLSRSTRAPQYLLDQDLSAEEVKVRNSIFTMKMVFEGLKRLVLRETTGDVLLVGHSTGGDIAFLGMADPEMAKRLKGRFLGWGSGGPSNLRREWEQNVGKWKGTVSKLSGYPPVWEVRTRDAEDYAESGYVGPLNPCAGSRAGQDMNDREIAERWLSVEDLRRPNFKQVLQDVEHHGASELKEKLEREMGEALSATRLPVSLKEVVSDLFYTNQSQVTGYRKMIWTVGKWDKGHWHKTDITKARELTIANQFSEKDPKTETRVLVFDLPLTHYGHIERPRQLAGGLHAAVQWLLQD